MLCRVYVKLWNARHVTKTLLFSILSDGTHDLPYLYFMGVKYFLTITHNQRSVKYLLYLVNWKLMISREVPLNCEEGCTILLHFEFAMLIFYQFDVFYCLPYLNFPFKMFTSWMIQGVRVPFFTLWELITQILGMLDHKLVKPICVWSLCISYGKI